MLAGTVLATLAAAGGSGEGPDQRRADVLFNRVLQRVVAADRGCLPRPLKTFTDAPPSAGRADALARRRRARGANDQPAAVTLTGDFLTSRQGRALQRQVLRGVFGMLRKRL